MNAGPVLVFYFCFKQRFLMLVPVWLELLWACRMQVVYHSGQADICIFLLDWEKNVTFLLPQIAQPSEEMPQHAAFHLWENAGVTYVSHGVRRATRSLLRWSKCSYVKDAHGCTEALFFLFFLFLISQTTCLFQRAWRQADPVSLENL